MIIAETNRNIDDNSVWINDLLINLICQIRNKKEFINNNLFILKDNFNRVT